MGHGTTQVGVESRPGGPGYKWVQLGPAAAFHLLPALLWSEKALRYHCLSALSRGLQKMLPNPYAVAFELRSPVYPWSCGRQAPVEAASRHGFKSLLWEGFFTPLTSTREPQQAACCQHCLQVLHSLKEQGSINDNIGMGCCLF